MCLYTINELLPSNVYCTDTHARLPAVQGTVQSSGLWAVTVAAGAYRPAVVG